MGTRRDPGFGLLLIDDRLSVDVEAAQGAGTTDSSYTQAGPQPGVPEPGDTSSTWRPQVTTYQDVGLSSIVLRSGFPGQDRAGRPAASVAVRSSSSSSETDYLGWDDPVTISGWTATANLFGGSANVDAVAATVLPDTQEVVLFTCTSAGASRLVARFDPRKEVWSETTNPLANVIISTPIALTYDSERERLILYTGSGDPYDAKTVAYYSVDKGVTWDLYARGLYDQTTLAGRTSVASPPQRAWAMFRASGDGYGQFASSDHGASWQRVDSGTSVIDGSDLRVVALKSGALLVAYVEVTTLDLKVKRLPTANTRWTDMTAVTVTTANCGFFSVAVDADGVVYLYHTTNASDRNVTLYRSLDEGVTWETYSFQPLSTGSGSKYGEPVHAVAAAGEVCIVHAISGAAALSDSVGLLRLGGWSSVEAGCGETDLSARTERLGFGAYNGTPALADGWAWYPVDIPDNMAWSATGTGTVAWTGASGAGMQVTCTNAQAQYYTRSGGNARVIAGEVLVTVTSGQNATTDGPQVHLYIADSAAGSPYEYELRLRFSSSTIKAVDPNGSYTATSASITELSTTGVYIRAVLTQDDAGAAFASVAYRVNGSKVWTILTDKQALTNAATPSRTGDGMLWGHYLTGNASDAVWRLAGFAPGGDWMWGIEDAADLQDEPWSEGHLGLSWGRALPGSTSPYPCPAAALTTYTTGSPTDCPRIFASGGPARISETTTLPVGYRRAFANVYPVTSPSPSRYWESTGTTEAKVAWNLTRANWLGDAVGLVVIGSYARQVALEYYDGAAWQTLGTLDLSLSAGTALNSTRAGDVLTPRSGTAEVTRYLQEGELVGGYAILSKGAGFVARRIVRQSSGYWSASAHQPVRITLEGVDGTEDVTGTADLIAPGGVLVAYPTTAQARQRWRVRWAASQTTPGSVYRAGIVGVGRVVGLGADPGWAWQRTKQLARQVTRDRGGRVRSVRQLQTPAETLSYDWADGVDLFALRSTRTPDYIATSTGLAIGSVEDAGGLLGHIEDAMKSGEVPCVVLPRLPTSTGTVLDSSLWFYGVLTSESVGLSGVDGTEGTDEYVRLTGAAFERLR